MLVAVVLALLAVCGACVRADTVTWTGPSGPWSTASNWSPARVPTANDTAVIPNPSLASERLVVGVDLATVHVASLTLGGATAGSTSGSVLFGCIAPGGCTWNVDVAMTVGARAAVTDVAPIAAGRWTTTYALTTARLEVSGTGASAFGQLACNASAITIVGDAGSGNGMFIGGGGQVAHWGKAVIDTALLQIDASGELMGPPGGAASALASPFPRVNATIVNRGTVTNWNVALDSSVTFHNYGVLGGAAVTPATALQLLWSTTTADPSGAALDGALINHAGGSIALGCGANACSLTVPRLLHACGSTFTSGRLQVRLGGQQSCAANANTVLANGGYNPDGTALCAAAPPTFTSSNLLTFMPAVDECSLLLANGTTNTTAPFTPVSLVGTIFWQNTERLFLPPRSVVIYDGGVLSSQNMAVYTSLLVRGVGFETLPLFLAINTGTLTIAPTAVSGVLSPAFNFGFSTFLAYAGATINAPGVSLLFTGAQVNFDQLTLTAEYVTIGSNTQMLFMSEAVASAASALNVRVLTVAGLLQIGADGPSDHQQVVTVNGAVHVSTGLVQQYDSTLLVPGGVVTIQPDAQWTIFASATATSRAARPPVRLVAGVVTVMQGAILTVATSLYSPPPSPADPLKAAPDARVDAHVAMADGSQLIVTATPVGTVGPAPQPLTDVNQLVVASFRLITSTSTFTAPLVLVQSGRLKLTPLTGQNPAGIEPRIQLNGPNGGVIVADGVLPGSGSGVQATPTGLLMSDAPASSVRLSGGATLAVIAMPGVPQPTLFAGSVVTVGTLAVSDTSGVEMRMGEVVDALVLPYTKITPQYFVPAANWTGGLTVRLPGGVLPAGQPLPFLWIPVSWTFALNAVPAQSVSAVIARADSLPAGVTTAVTMHEQAMWVTFLPAPPMPPSSSAGPMPGPASSSSTGANGPTESSSGAETGGGGGGGGGSPSGGLSGGAKAGIAIGVIAGVGLLGGAAWYWHVQRRKSSPLLLNEADSAI